jgi:lipopolysaccharide transport protein LptA
VSGLVLALVLGAQAPPPQGPVRYHAELLRTEPKEHRIFLDGEVNIARGDLVVTGAHAVAELSPEKPPASAEPQKQKVKKPEKKVAAPVPLLGAEVQRFTVDGAVHVDRAGRTADGDHAVYDAEAQTLTLTGPAAARADLPASPVPVLRDGQELLAGEKIVLHLEKDDVEVQRPRMVLRRSQAAEKGPPGETGAQTQGPPVPVRIESKTLVIDQDRRILKFRDEVVLHRGDLVAFGPKLDARYDAGGDIEDLELTGGVVLRQGTRRATGKVATYDARSRNVVLTGDPRLRDRGDELQGDRIEMSLDSEEVKVAHAKGRLRPDSHKGEDPPKSSAPPAKAADRPAADQAVKP